MNYTIRIAEAQDEAFLWDMLYFAAHMAEDGHLSSDDAKDDPLLSRYVADWGKEDDLGVVAVGEEGERLGACWVRLLHDRFASYPYIPQDYPELAIAVWPHYAGQGIGAQLLEALLDLASERFAGIVLTVRVENPALHLYERFGFERVDEIMNRIGGVSYVMAKAFA
jgi:ribosomal protein S18 acetylase RimI-like enzyme